MKQGFSVLSTPGNLATFIFMLGQKEYGVKAVSLKI